MDIKPQYKHSNIGNFLFELSAKATKFLVQHKSIYYVLACTWGFLLTFCGVLITLFFGLLGTNTLETSFYLFDLIYYFKIGPDYWGGLEMGLMFIRDQKSDDELNCHEFGHTFQNCLFGPFMIIIVGIPSAIRYWVRKINKNIAKTPYDNFWAEDSATQCGKYAHEYLASSAKK